MTQARIDISRIDFTNSANLHQPINLAQSADFSNDSFVDVLSRLSLQSADSSNSERVSGSDLRIQNSTGPIEQPYKPTDASRQDPVSNVFNTEQPPAGVGIQQLRFGRHARIQHSQINEPALKIVKPSDQDDSSIILPDRSIHLPNVDAGKLEQSDRVDRRIQIKTEENEPAIIQVLPIGIPNDQQNVPQLNQGSHGVSNHLVDLANVDLTESNQHRNPQHLNPQQQVHPYVVPSATLLEKNSIGVDFTGKNNQGTTTHFGNSFPVLKQPVSHAAADKADHQQELENDAVTILEIRNKEKLTIVKSKAEIAAESKTDRYTLGATLKQNIKSADVQLPGKTVQQIPNSEQLLTPSSIQADTVVFSLIDTIVAILSDVTLDNIDQVEGLESQFEPVDLRGLNIHGLVPGQIKGQDSRIDGQSHANGNQQSHSLHTNALKNEDHVNYHKQLLDRISQAFLDRQDSNASVRFRLQVPKLGVIDIDIQINQSLVSAAISAESATTRQLVAENLTDLRQRLSQQGINQENLDIRVVVPADNESLTDDSGSQAGQRFPRSPRLPRDAGSGDKNAFSQHLVQVDIDVLNVRV